MRFSFLISITALSLCFVSVCNPVTTELPTKVFQSVTDPPADASPSSVATTKVVPTFVQPVSGWDKRYISRVPIKDMAGKSTEEIVKALLIQWLDYYETGTMDEDYKIANYTIEKVFLKDNTHQQYDIVAEVVFLVEPVRLPDGWIGAESIILENGWVQRDLLFGVFRENENFRLIMLIGWGT